jgi:hypothetical protein
MDKLTIQTDYTSHLASQHEMKADHDQASAEGRTLSTPSAGETSDFLQVWKFPMQALQVLTSLHDQSLSWRGGREERRHTQYIRQLRILVLYILNMKMGLLNIQLRRLWHSLPLCSGLLAMPSVKRRVGVSEGWDLLRRKYSWRGYLSTRTLYMC